MFQLRLPSLTALLCSAAALVNGRAEVIYDNTQFYLNGYASETGEYGDQLDLEGTARTLTELSFFYYGDFEPDGNEAMKVRLYSNETPYDLYRNSPTRLLYESGNLPFNNGYNSQTLSNLNVKLPLDTMTFSIEFKGLKANEIAGLLFYSPPTVGASFNEFWKRNPDGGWYPFQYSTTDPSRKANAGIKLVARTDSVAAAWQTNAAASLPLRTATNSWRMAQTFTPNASGRLESAAMALTWSGLPVQLLVMDATNGAPGINLLGSVTQTNSVGGQVSASFYDQQIYLAAGQQYALVCRSDNPETDSPQYLLGCSAGDAYAGGQLWAAPEPDGAWQTAALPTGETNIDASFSVSIIPAAPPVLITTPAVGAVIPFGSSVRFAAELNLPKISQVWRVRFFDGNNEIDELVNPPHSAPPFEIFWQSTNAGPHTLKVIVEDGFRRPFRTDTRVVTVAPPLPAIDRVAKIERKADGGMTLRFETAPDQRIRVEYSEDLSQWKAAPVEAVGNGLEISYDDEGPPKTSRSPKESPQRYYRIRFGD